MAHGREQRVTTRWLLIQLGIWALAAAALIVFGHSRPSGCSELSLRVPFAGGRREFDAAIAACGDISAGPTRDDLLLEAAAFSLLLFLLVPILHLLWKVSWRAEPFSRWTFMGAVPAGAGALGSIATILFAVGASTDGDTLSLSDGYARAIAATTWPASGFAILAVGAVGISALTAIGSAGVPAKEDLPPGRPWAPDPMEGHGICVSGGGIRASAFSLGVLSYLERHRMDGSPATVADRDGVLDTARYLASVSGGGYTAGAWRVARGNAAEEGADTAWPEGIFGDPTELTTMPTAAFDDADPDEGHAPSLYTHMWERRQFLRTGRGGMSVSVAFVLLTIVLQLALIALFVVVFAWPIGLLARSWAVLGPTWFARDPYQFSASARSWTPVLVVLSIAAVVIVFRNFMLRTKLRLELDAAVGVLILVAVVLTGVLVVLPSLIAAIADLGGAVGAITGVFAAGGVVAFASRTLTKVLRPRLIRLGGLLFSLAAVAFALLVVRAAAIPDGFLRGDIDVGLFSVPAGVAYAVLALAALIAWSFGDPRWWSLFPVYRNRIRAAFAVTTDQRRTTARHAVSSALYPLSRKHEPTLDEYQGAPGPTHLVCCAAARANGTATGIPALSFVFAPDEVRMYESGPETVTVHSAPTEQYVRSLGREVFTQLPARRPKSLGTVSAAVAMSGAAVTSSMGRFDLGSTNTLIAGMNVRLGAWVPNPRYVAIEETPAKRARLNYLLKEMMGWYDLADPHVYITDGGHWDNLGLVELLRRRCETVICVDASGDQPGSFSTFFDALELARIECDAFVDISVGDHGVSAMRTTGDCSRPATSTAVGTIHYGDEQGSGGVGRILYIKAQVCDDLPTPMIGFSFQDPEFPNYSTADQFLTADQFRQLAMLGWESAKLGLPKLANVQVARVGDE